MDTFRQCIGIIPARYGSTRFPGKPLVDIGGQSMVQRVYERCLLSKLDRTVVATDDERIAAHVRSWGGEVVLTSSDLTSGTARCSAALAQLSTAAALVVNVQGDEPFIAPGSINAVLQLLQERDADIATLTSRSDSERDVSDPNRVKVVLAADGRALYFSRSSIPYRRFQSAACEYHLHVGIYGFRSEVLQRVVTLPEGMLEAAEGLEQLRWLEQGYAIHTAETQERVWAVDSPEDLQRLLEHFDFD